MRRHTHPGFTLMELLTVLSTLWILAAILTPAILRARDYAHQLVDGQPIFPTIPAVHLAPARTGTMVSTVAMPLLPAGKHRIQVEGWATEGAIYRVSQHALTVIGPLQ